MRTMSAREARANFSDLLGSVYYTKEAIMVEKKGKPYAVVISPEDYAALENVRARGFAAIDAIQTRNADKSEADVLADVTADVEAVRRDTYERKQPTARRR